MSRVLGAPPGAEDLADQLLGKLDVLKVRWARWAFCALLCWERCAGHAVLGVLCML